MKKIALLVFLCSFSVSGQRTILKGKLLDKTSKEPVVYANISFINIKNGISSREDGSFELEIKKEDSNRRIHISCLNYQDTIVLAKDIKNKTFYMTPKSYELDEIVLSRKSKKEVIIDKYLESDIKASFGTSKGFPWVATKFFKHSKSYSETPYLKNVTIYLNQSRVMRNKGKFRLRFYAVNTESGGPSEDLIKDNIIITVKKNDKKISLDVTQYDIEIPESGFYIGVERLEIPYNFNEYKYTMSGSKKKYTAISVAPSVGAVYTRDSIYKFANGKWYEYYISKKIYKGYNIQPAISITLTN